MEYLFAAISLLLSPTALLALVIYTLLTFVSEWSGAYLSQAWRTSPSMLWLAEHLYIPWFNLLALAIFLSMLYPQLYGLDGGTYAEISLKNVVDIALFISLILPLIPAIGRAEFALPIQGIIIVTLLFNGIDKSTADIEISYWPAWPTIGMIIGISILTMFLSRLSAAHLGEWLDQQLERKGFERALQHGIQLTLQSPAIFIYAMGLGAQLSS
ncbi:MAG TPA: hypothetical protein ENH92_00115 [Ectothiorhodospiraceae bacterium]|nr:hypothetical protein [Ectothiorhodospiraceae bacterium]